MGEIKEWLYFAYSDILVCEEILHNDFLTHIVAFHSEQAVEKSFKALITHSNNKVPKQHDLIRLYGKIKNYLDIDNESILDDLNKLYIDSRYPSFFGLLPYGKPTLEDAKKFYEFAKDVFERVCEVLEIDKNEVQE